MTGIDCRSVPVSFGNRMFSKHDSEEQKMRPYKMFLNTATALTEDELYQSATALHPVPQPPTPLNPCKGVQP